MDLRSTRRRRCCSAAGTCRILHSTGACSTYASGKRAVTSPPACDDQHLTASAPDSASPLARGDEMMMMVDRSGWTTRCRIRHITDGEWTSPVGHAPVIKEATTLKTVGGLTFDGTGSHHTRADTTCRTRPRRLPKSAPERNVQIEEEYAEAANGARMTNCARTTRRRSKLTRRRATKATGGEGG